MAGLAPTCLVLEPHAQPMNIIHVWRNTSISEHLCIIHTRLPPLSQQQSRVLLRQIKQLKIPCCDRPWFHTRKFTPVQNEAGWLYVNYLPGGGKVGHVTSLEFCCCLTNFLQHFSEKFDNRTNQYGKCFWQMVAGLKNYDLKILYSFYYIATTALHVTGPGKRCFHTS